MEGVHSVLERLLSKQRHNVRMNDCFQFLRIERVSGITVPRNIFREFFWIVAMREGSRVLPSYKRRVIIGGLSVVGIGSKLIDFTYPLPRQGHLMRRKSRRAPGIGFSFYTKIGVTLDGSPPITFKRRLSKFDFHRNSSASRNNICVTGVQTDKVGDVSRLPPGLVFMCARISKCVSVARHKCDPFFLEVASCPTVVFHWSARLLLIALNGEGRGAQSSSTVHLPPAAPALCALTQLNHSMLQARYACLSHSDKRHTIWPSSPSAANRPKSCSMESPHPGSQTSDPVRSGSFSYWTAQPPWISCAARPEIIWRRSVANARASTAYE